LPEPTANSVANTSITDSAATPNTVTRNGTVSTGITSPYQTDGYWSNYFLGSSSGAYLTTPTNTAFQLTTSNFTIEFWALPLDPSVTNTSFCRTDTGGTSFNGMILGLNDGTNLVWYASSAGGSWDIINGGVICTFASVKNKWTHFAFVRSGSVFTAYVNGTQTYTITSPASIYQATNGFRIGTANNAADTTNFNGYISNFRYVKGTAIVPPAGGPTSPLTAVTNTQLLTCQSNRFIDNSTANAGVGWTLTVNGTPRVPFNNYPSAFTAPAASPGAGYFNDLISNYLTVSSPGTNLQFTGDFTVEMWYYVTSGAEVSIFIEFTSPNYFAININPSGNAFAIYLNSASPTFSPTATIPLSAWNHIALVRSGSAAGNIKLYLNGTALGTTGTNTSTLGFSSPSYARIGGGGASQVGAYISNVRVVKGTAVYTGNFTPPSGFLTQTGGTYPSTTNVNTSIPSANTTLLLNLSEGNTTAVASGGNNNVYVDSSINGYTLTRSGGPTQTSFTPYWPEGYWGVSFNGTSDYLSIAANANLAFGTGDFTVEGWIHALSTAQFNLLTLNATFQFFVANNLLYIYDNGTQTSGGTIALNTWYHIAIARSGTAMRCYINGVSVISVSSSTAFTQTTNQIANNTGSSYGYGYVSNLRVIKNQALITGSGSFTPPTGPLTTSAVGWASIAGSSVASSITGTVSLLTCQSNRFKDNSPSPIAISVVSTPKAVAFQPFNPPASYTTALYGGSNYNLTKTDVITAVSNPAIISFPGDFTLECWVYPTDTSLSTTWGIMDARENSSATSWIWLLNGYSAGVGWNVQFYNAGVNNFNTTKVPANAWSHIVLQRNATSLRCFVNGVVDATVLTLSGTLTGGSISTVTFNNTKDSSNSGYGNIGYLSNLRIVNGTAVYTTTGFTPPTAPVTAITNTSLLLNYTNAGIYDAALQIPYVTSGNAVTNATSPTPKWPPLSMKFDGTASTAITVYDALNGPTDLNTATSTQAWTIECWIYYTAGGAIFNKGGNPGVTSSSYSLTVSGGTGTFYVSNSTGIGLGTGYSITYSAGSIPTGTWVYWAATRTTAGVITTYINGVSQGSSGSGINIYNINNYQFSLGAHSTITYGIGNILTGAIQDFRITKGVVRTITTPTSAFPTK
jgi:hypothetical protein